MSLNSWRSLPQEPRWNKQKLRRLGVRMLVVVLLASVFCAISFYFHPHSQPQPFKKLVFSTNGILTEAWLKSHLSMPWGKDLLSINLEKLQTRILRYHQIKAVDISREFPDTLKITLTERTACSKIFVLKDSEKSIRLISKEGFIFPPVGYKKEMIRLLPTISNIPQKLIIKDEILGFCFISEMIDFLKENAKDLLLNLRCISLQNFDPFLQKHWHCVDLELRNSFTIVFPLASPEKALNKLKSILNALSKKQRNSLRKINVALTAPTIEFQEVKNKSK